MEISSLHGSTGAAVGQKGATEGMFITDTELRERFGIEAEIIIDKLDRDPKTQKGLATRPADVRYRPAVDEWLKANGHTA